MHVSITNDDGKAKDYRKCYVDLDDGNIARRVELEFSDHFINWFKKREGLARFSRKRFKKFLSENLEVTVVGEEVRMSFKEQKGV